MEGSILFSKVWAKGEGGTEAFGAFGVSVTKKGTVLAFAEGRIQWRDYDPQHIFLKRSLDGGITWSPNQVVCESRFGEVFHNPTPVYDSISETIFLFYANCCENLDSRVQFIKSVDDGLTWTGPFDITAKFENDEKKRFFHLPGPGHGIQMRSGRLIIPVWHRHPVDKNFLPHISDRDYGNSVLYSDDNGKSWTNGGFTDFQTESSQVGQTSECRCLELDDGVLLMNARMGIPHRLATGPNRIIRLSLDEGESWEKEVHTVFDASFPTDSPSIAFDNEYQVYARPDCGAGIHENHPNNGRRNMTVYLCSKGMREINSQRVVDPGNSYYSDLCLLPDQSIFLLYGKGFFNNWMGNQVSGARFDLSWLRNS